MPTDDERGLMQRGGPALDREHERREEDLPAPGGSEVPTQWEQEPFAVWLAGELGRRVGVIADQQIAPLAAGLAALQEGFATLQTEQARLRAQLTAHESRLD